MPTDATATKAAKVSVQDAIAAALKATSGTVSSAGLEQGKSGPVWMSRCSHRTAASMM